MGCVLEFLLFELLAPGVYLILRILALFVVIPLAWLAMTPLYVAQTLHAREPFVPGLAARLDALAKRIGAAVLPPAEQTPGDRGGVARKSESRPRRRRR